MMPDARRQEGAGRVGRGGRGGGEGATARSRMLGKRKLRAEMRGLDHKGDAFPGRLQVHAEEGGKTLKVFTGGGL